MLADPATPSISSGCPGREDMASANYVGDVSPCVPQKMGLSKDLSPYDTRLFAQE